MESIIEKSIREFYSTAIALSKVSEDIVMEDALFTKFTELLELGDIVKNPIPCRYIGGGISNPWELMGYSLIVEGGGDSNDPEKMNESYLVSLFAGFFQGSPIIENAKKTDLTRSVNNLIRFLNGTLAKGPEFFVKDEHPIRELQEELFQAYNKNQIERIELFIITDSIITQEDLIKEFSSDKINVDAKIEYWDFRRWHELYRSKSKREPINFNLKEMGYSEIQISSTRMDSDQSCHMCALPGDLISDLYKLYHTRLLESNVRVFLSLKRKTNRNMVKTITDIPEMFLAFNNGLSATASEISISEKGHLVSVNDFQIVNGGQTTATLYHAKTKLKKSLKKVNVACKLTVIKEPELQAANVPEISRYANTQTAIKRSDFEANQHYFLEFSKYSKKNFITNSSGINMYYYFERMTGQYNEDKNKQGTKRNQLEWSKRHPKSMCFNKIDLGRWINIMRGFPHVAASSAEKSFDFFAKFLKTEDTFLSTGKFKTIVGFGVIFNQARAVCGTKNGRRYPSIIGDSSVGMATTIYAMAYLHHVTSERFDYHLFFDRKLNVETIDNILSKLIKAVWKELAKFGGSSVQEQTKKEKCWNFLLRNIELDAELKRNISTYCIDVKEQESRNQIDRSEAESYFTLLDKFIANDCRELLILSDLAQTNGDFIAYKSLARNLENQIIKKNARIPLSRLLKLNEFSSSVKSSQKLFNTNRKFTINANIMSIYEEIFAQKSALNKLQESIMNTNGEEFEKGVELLDKITDFKETFESWESCSIGELENTQELINDLKNIIRQFSDNCKVAQGI